jgi:hypothetical protein
VSPALDDGALFVGSPGTAGFPGFVTGFEATGPIWVQAHTLSSSTAIGLGRACSLDGNVLLVSSWGAAYFFRRTGATWVEEGRVTPFITGLTDFGRSVAVDGDTAVVGAPLEAHSGASHLRGALYVFERGPGGWARTARLQSTPPQSFFEDLGSSVAIDGDRILAGSLSSIGFHPPGTAYIFERSAGIWTQVAALQDINPIDFSDDLGRGVDIVGNRAYVGAPRSSWTVSDAGAVHVFEDGPSGWTEIHRLEHPTPTVFGNFGYSLAATDEHLLVGAWSASALLFSTADWVLEATFEAGDLSDGFAKSVDLSEQHAVVSAPFAEDAHVFSLVVSDRYCEALPNSTGEPALLHALGCSDTLANDFELLATPVPAGQPGLFFFGPGEMSLPFGNGRRCVTGGVADIHRLPTTSADASGDLALNVDFGTVGAIAPGSTWKFQALFRDPAAQGAGFNLSDGLSVTFQ